MKALIIAPGEYAGNPALYHRLPAELHPVGDRSWLQRVVESAVEGGVNTIEAITCHRSHKIESVLGEGQRWGSKLTYTLAQDPRQPYRALRGRAEFSGWLWVLHARWLRSAPLPAVQEGTPLLLRDSTGKWAGAAWMAAEELQGFLKLSLEEVEESLSTRDWPSLTQTHCFVLDSVASLLAANSCFLDEPAAWSRSGREIEAGIWLGRDVSLHPTAVLEAPVYLSPHCRIGAGVRLGPHVTIGSSVVIEARSTARNTLIMEGCYVGPGLELESALVDHHRLMLADGEGALHVSDPLMLAAMDNTRETIHRTFGRFWACLLLLALLPAWALERALRQWQGSGTESERVRQPGPDDPEQWVSDPVHYRLGPFTSLRQHFWTQFLPGLTSVIKGSVYLVGCRVRNAEQLLALDEDHRSQAMRCPSGLVTETLVKFGPTATPDQVFVCESYYAAVRGPLYDARLLFHYLLRVFAPQPPA